jgi:hypothetical protein
MGLADRDYMRRDDRGDRGPDHLFDPPETRHTRHRRSTRYTAVMLAIALVGLSVLPLLAIAGHHHMFWIF